MVADKSAEQIAAVLGVLYSGAAYLPVDAALPPDRIAHLLRRGQARAALTHGGLVAGLGQPAGVTVFPLDDPAAWADADDSALPDAQGGPDLAYVIFTSGSTGEPKGVMIEHQAAANTVADINTRFALTAADRVLGLSALGFDLSVWDIFGTLAAGAALVLPDPGSSRDPQHWAALIAEHHVTIWNTVPALMEMLVTHAEGTSAASLAGLRAVLLSGDWIPLTLPDRIRALARPEHLISLGGATEAAIWSIYHPIGQNLPGWASVPYGTPLAAQAFHILDQRLAPRPDWAAGDLYIAGAGLARGYWQDPGTTSAAFIRHPVTGQRLYRTGDLGRYHPDGTIEFLGRTDSQVKINGYRIELGEIDATLTRHPAVARAATTATNGHLTSYITLAAACQAMPGEAELAGHCARYLPGWMVPRRITVLDRLPLTANGKVDRGALRATEPLSDPAPERLGPRTDMERALYEIWAEVLGTQDLGVLDDFVASGGDSLRALQVVNKAGAGGIRIGIRDFFANPTIAGLAELANDTAGLREVPSEQLDAAELPLLPRQLAFLTGHYGSSGTGTVPEHWNYAMLFRPAAPMAEPAVRAALAAVIRRHDGLRVRFARGDDGWHAHVAAVGDFALPFTWSDISGLPPGQRQAAIEGTCRTLQTSLRLAGPLFQVAYFRTGTPDGDRLFVVGHWLLWDGYSVQVVLDDLITGYDQLTAGGPAQLPPATPLTRWACDLAALSANHAFDGELPYWQSLLRRPAGAIPVDHDQPNLSSDERTALASVRPAVTAAVLRLPENSGTTVTDVLVTATARAVAAWAGLGLVRVDVDGHGRDRPGITADPSRTVGRLSVRRPLDVVPGLDAGLLDAARGTTASRRAASQDGANYDILAYLDGSHHDLRSTSAQILFNYLGQLEGLWAGGRLRLASEDPGPAHARDVKRGYPLDLMLGVTGENLLIACTYSSACHDEQTIGRLLNAIVADIHDAFGFPVPDGTAPEPQGAAMLGHWLRGQ